MGTNHISITTFSGEVVATSLPYLAVHRWIAGDVPIYLKMTHPSENDDFDRFRLTMPQQWEIAKKLSLIGSRQCAFHRVIDEPCALPLSTPKGGSKGQFFLHLALPGNRRRFKFGVHVDHNKSQPTDNTLSLIGARSLSRDLFNVWKISDNISKTVQDSVIVSIKFE